MNRVTLIGNLGKDPEVRHFDNGTTKVSFSLATSERYQDKDNNWQETTEWHDIILWRNQAELALKILKKGMPIFLEGKLTHRTWQDAEGKNRRTTEVVGSQFRILEKRSTAGDGSSGLGTESGGTSATEGTDEGELPF